jgi:hypothetical protein
MLLLRAALRRMPRMASAPAAIGRQVRHMGGHSEPVGYGSGPYRGIKIPKVAQWHKNVATFYGTVLWLWLFWRAKNDGPALLGWEHPWDHGDHGHDHDEHGEEEHH